SPLSCSHTYRDHNSFPTRRASDLAAKRMDVRARSATVDATLVKPRHIGIVACSAEGAALCYRTIVHEGAALLGEHEHPEITLSSDRKSTRLNSSHLVISYAVFCL